MTPLSWGNQLKRNILVFLSVFTTIYKYRIFSFLIKIENPTNNSSNEPNLLLLVSTLLMGGCILVWLRCCNRNNLRYIWVQFLLKLASMFSSIRVISVPSIILVDVMLVSIKLAGHIITILLCSFLFFCLLAWQIRWPLPWSLSIKIFSWFVNPIFIKIEVIVGFFKKATKEKNETVILTFIFEISLRFPKFWNDLQMI